MSLWEKLDKAGWRQGCFLHAEDNAVISNQVRQSLNSHDRLIVISQSCDILARRDELEPKVELIIAKPIKAPATIDHGKTFAQHPREFHFTTTGEYDLDFSVCQNDKIVIDRAVLANETSPDFSIILRDRTKKDLTHWLASRYDRPAFPNSFEERLSQVARKYRDKERDAAKKSSEFLSGVFLRLDPKTELSPDQNYNVLMIVLVSVKHKVEYRGVEAKDIPNLSVWVSHIVNLFKQANMSVVHRIQWEDQVPWSVIQYDYDRWHYDGLSLRQDPPDPMPKR